MRSAGQAASFFGPARPGPARFSRGLVVGGGAGGATSTEPRAHGGPARLSPADVARELFCAELSGPRCVWTERESERERDCGAQKKLPAAPKTAARPAEPCCALLRLLPLIAPIALLVAPIAPCCLLLHPLRVLLRLLRLVASYCALLRLLRRIAVCGRRVWTRCA